MINNQDPRIERWMQKVADEMQRMIEQQGQERAQQIGANRTSTTTGASSSGQGRPPGATGASNSEQEPEQGDEEMTEQGMQDDMPTDDPQEEAEDDTRTSEDVAGDVIMLVTGSLDIKQTAQRKQVRWTDGEDKMR